MAAYDETEGTKPGTKVKLGKHEYEVRVGRYANNVIAIGLFDPETGEQGLITTVNVVGPTLPDEYALPSRQYVWMKTWSENEGVPELLQSAKVITLTETTKDLVYPTHKVAIRMAKLTDEFVRKLPVNAKIHIMSGTN